MLNVLVRSEGGGDCDVRARSRRGAGVALLRLRFADFGDGSREVPRRALPGRFPARGQRLVVPQPLRRRLCPLRRRRLRRGRPAREPRRRAASRGGPVAELAVAHSVDRIELLGGDAMAIGGAPRGLGFTAVELGGRRARASATSTSIPTPPKGETRSHAFFFSPDPATPDGASGTLGLPVARRADPALARFFGSSAAMVFLRREQRRLAPAGELEAQTKGVADDGCKASCVDWYGNARPIFLGGRTFALLGYELVEGELARGRIREVGRISFAPPPAARQ